MPRWHQDENEVKMTFATPRGIDLKAELDADGKSLTVSGEGKDDRGVDWSYSRTMSLPFQVAGPEAIQMLVDPRSQELTIKVPSSAALPQPEPRTITIQRAEDEQEVKKLEETKAQERVKK